MKKYFLTILTIFITISALFAQNLKVETEYLHIINNQGDKFLIKNNIPTAEMCADSLMTVADYDNPLGAMFFYELGKSYYLIKKYDLAVFSFLRQRILFPGATVSGNVEFLMQEAALKGHLRNFEDFYNGTFANDLIAYSYEKRLLLVIKYGVQLKNKEIMPIVWRYAQLYEKIAENNSPFWLAKWKYLYQRNVCVSKQVKYLDFSKTKTTYSFEELYEDLPWYLTK